jgi:hypothetical protein
LALVLTAVGCVHERHGARAAAQSYAQALESDWRQGEGWVVGGASPAWVAFYTDESNRQAKARNIQAALAGQSDAPGLLMEYAQGQWRVVDSGPAQSLQAAADAILLRFLQAADEGDFKTAWTLLAPSLRSRYTPARLKEDFQNEPKSQERLGRVKAAAGQKWQATSEGAEQVLGEGKSVKLVREGDAWRVAALE